MMDAPDLYWFAGMCLLILFLLYVIIKMIWNRINGRDELDGFF